MARIGAWAVPGDTTGSCLWGQPFSRGATAGCRAGVGTAGAGDDVGAPGSAYPRPAVSGGGPVRAVDAESLCAWRPGRPVVVVVTLVACLVIALVALVAWVTAHAVAVGVGMAAVVVTGLAFLRSFACARTAGAPPYGGCWR